MYDTKLKYFNSEAGSMETFGPNICLGPIVSITCVKRTKICFMFLE